MPEEHEAVTRLIAGVWHAVRAGALDDGALRRVREAFGPALSPETLQGRGLAKKFGYAGDFEFLDVNLFLRLDSPGAA